ncbi:MAG: PDZ domain-containing protein [Myxococcales bacterium]|nr:PDZ domain-containing protein [Myxococcales bacterium]
MTAGPSARRKALLLCAALVGACAPVTSERLARLEREEQRRQARLEQLKDEIARAEDAATRAERAAARQQCKAQVAALESDVSIASARCYSELAAAEACRATNERRKTDSSLFGCTLGVAAAVFSGGSLSGLALAGCAAGYAVGASEAKECSPTTDCLVSADQWARAAARSRGLQGIPICGVGVEVDLVPGQAVGALVTEVWRDIPIAIGDVILGVNNKRVSSSSDLNAAVAGSRPGSIVRVDLVRGAYAGMVHVDIVYVDEPAADRGRPLLGVRVDDRRPVRFGQVVVAAVAPASPAERAGVGVGDVLVAIDTDAIASAPGAIVSELERRAWRASVTFRSSGGFKTASLEE